jgi:hypothetical protein
MVSLLLVLSSVKWPILDRLLGNTNVKLSCLPSLWLSPYPKGLEGPFQAIGLYDGQKADGMQ